MGANFTTPTYVVLLCNIGIYTVRQPHFPKLPGPTSLQCFSTAVGARDTLPGRTNRRIKSSRTSTCATLSSLTSRKLWYHFAWLWTAITVVVGSPGTRRSLLVDLTWGPMMHD
jgi:hypothetical protein